MTQYIVSNNELFIRKTELEDLNYVLQAEQDPESKKFILSWSREQHERAISNDDSLHLIVEDTNRRKIGLLLD